MAGGFNTRWTGGSWPDSFGGHKAGAVGYSGPTSYVPATGDAIATDGILGSGTRTHAIIPSLTSDGLYEVKVQPDNAVGVPSSWAARWFYAGNISGVDGVVIATAGSGQTNGTYSIAGSGGGGTGATVGITIAGGAITAAQVTNPGSGYTSAPTFTVSEGGTPGTLTASVGNVGGGEVAAGTDLSGSTAILFAIGA